MAKSKSPNKSEMIATVLLGFGFNENNESGEELMVNKLRYRKFADPSFHDVFFYVSARGSVKKGSTLKTSATQEPVNVEQLKVAYQQFVQ